jgi:hypothetical protein
MMKGVISFVVASVFLLVLLSSATAFSRQAQDYSYQPLVAVHLRQEAVKAALSGALAEAAQKAVAASVAAGADAPALVNSALYLSALDFEAQLRNEGYDAAFWCGRTGESARQAASEAMRLGGRAEIPQGALALSNPACAGSFEANLLKGRARVRDAGFSIYSPGTGVGLAYQLPDDYGADFDG